MQPGISTHPSFGSSAQFYRPGSLCWAIRSRESRRKEKQSWERKSCCDGRGRPLHFEVRTRAHKVSCKLEDVIRWCRDKQAREGSLFTDKCYPSKHAVPAQEGRNGRGQVNAMLLPHLGCSAKIWDVRPKSVGGYCGPMMHADCGKSSQETKPLLDVPCERPKRKEELCKNPRR